VSAAAETVEATRTPLLDELEVTLGTFAGFARPAQRAVATVALSLAGDTSVTDQERDLATALLVLSQAL
jgi:hypothetical protein